MFWLTARGAASPQIGAYWENAWGLLMSVGFLHSNGNCPDSLTARPSSSDRPRSDRPVPQSFRGLLPARQQLATSPWLPPTALQHPGSTSPRPPVRRESTANRPRTHAPTRTHALIIFETRQIYSTASLAASSDHHQCFCCIVFSFLDRGAGEEKEAGPLPALDPDRSR